MPGEPEVRALVSAALDAINSRDAVALRALLHPNAELRTGRKEHCGVDEVIAWSQKRYDHLDKRYELDELRVEGDHVLALARVQYVWRESGELGDEEPIAILFEIDGRLISRLALYDDVASARAAARS